MAKAPLSKNETLFDDLLDETNLILSNDDRLEELDESQKKALASILAPTDLEIGKPVAIILFWHVTHCLHCGASYTHPRYGTGAMLKRWFARRRLFVYENLLEYKGAAFDSLTHRTETSHSDITCCVKCFDRVTDAVDYICPECLSSTPDVSGTCSTCLSRRT